MKIKFTRKFLFMALMAWLLQPGCKKVDLERIAMIKTNPVSDITINTAVMNAEIIDIGEKVKSYGFVVATYENPTITDQKVIAGNNPVIGSFSQIVDGLSQNTGYWVRGFVESESSVVYGENVTFKTTAGTSTAWLNYDNGQNNDGIGLTNGGSFDAVIRFTPDQLAPYDGFTITKIKFFPRMNSSAAFSTEIFEGTNLTGMQPVSCQEIESPVLDHWNEITLLEPHSINASNELLVGYWVYNQLAGDYPAGIDAGPAQVGFGDLISFDDGATWESLTEASGYEINANWNIQVYVTNEKGQMIHLNPGNGVISRKSGKRQVNPGISTFNSSNR
ncbi:MAG TPA: hypothetical protein PLI65_09880 [Bacteroidales bacterium]|nr:hypothetical protein [Bacteroidales bacterium]HPR58269.1 hypothetical protein [Bacteroidales bacterium]HRW97311.1 hypothetical protein [Bacteroidales bacterium]